MADIKDVIEKNTALQPLWTRMDADRDLAYLKPYTLEDAAGKSVSGIINVTLNLPATFSAHVQSALMAATQQPEVTGEGLEDAVTSEVERFLDALFLSSDELLMRRGEPRLRAFITEQLCLRGRSAVRVTTRMENGVFVADLMPIDTRYFVYEMGKDGLEWAAYITWRSATAINQEYPGANAKGALPIAVTDFWDKDTNRVFMGDSLPSGTVLTRTIGIGRLLRETKHSYGEPPFAFRIVPLGSMFKDNDAVSRQGESIFFLIRDLIPELNRLASIMQTNNMASVKPALQWLNKEGPDATPPSDFPIGSVTSADIEGGASKVPMGDLTAAGRLMYDILSRMSQAGSLSTTDYGNLNFPLSAVALIELGEASSQVFLPRLGTKGLLYQQMADMVIRQALSLGVSEIVLGSKGHRQTFKASSLQGDYDIEYKYFVKKPQIDVALYSLADSARAFLPNEEIVRNLLHLENPTAILHQKRLEEAEELSTGVKLLRTAHALIDAGRIAEASIMADEMGITLEQLTTGDVRPDLPAKPKPQPARNIALPGTRAESNTRAEQLATQPRNGSREE